MLICAACLQYLARRQPLNVSSETRLEDVSAVYEMDSEICDAQAAAPEASFLALRDGCVHCSSIAGFLRSQNQKPFGPGLSKKSWRDLEGDVAFF